MWTSLSPFPRHLSRSSHRQNGSFNLEALQVYFLSVVGLILARPEAGRTRLAPSTPEVLAHRHPSRARLGKGRPRLDQ